MIKTRKKKTRNGYFKAGFFFFHWRLHAYANMFPKNQVGNPCFPYTYTYLN